MKTVAFNLDTLSDDALLARVVELVGRSRRVEAELVWHLAEVDARRLHLREACPSMHVYATSRLHLSDAEAYLRITVARVSRRCPAVLAMLADGRLHLSAIAKLAPHLRADGGEALLARAAHRSKREIEMLVAELAPRPDVPSLMRRLPTPKSSVSIGTPGLGPGGVDQGEARNPAALFGAPAAPLAAAPLAAAPTIGATPLGAAPVTAAAPIGAVPVAAAAVPVATPAAPLASPVAPVAAALPLAASAAVRPSSVVVAIAPSRYRVQFTASGELQEKLVRAQALLRADIPDGDLAAIVERAMDLLLGELERVRFAATSAPRKSADECDPNPSSRDIPDPIRRAVWLRDGGQCTFHDRSGRRCPGRERLEFRHLVPFAQGGDHGESNVTLFCARHNQYQADLDYGAAFMAARRAGTRAPRIYPD